MSFRITRERVGTANERRCQTVRPCHRLCPPYKLLLPSQSRMLPLSANQEVANPSKPESEWDGERESRRAATATRHDSALQDLNMLTKTQSARARSDEERGPLIIRRVDA